MGILPCTPIAMTKSKIYDEREVRDVHQVKPSDKSGSNIIISNLSASEVFLRVETGGPKICSRGSGLSKVNILVVWKDEGRARPSSTTARGRNRWSSNRLHSPIHHPVCTKADGLPFHGRCWMPRAKCCSTNDQQSIVVPSLHAHSNMLTTDIYRD